MRSGKRCDLSMSFVDKKGEKRISMKKATMNKIIEAIWEHKLRDSSTYQLTYAYTACYPKKFKVPGPM